MKDIQWYPGHMTKTRRMIEQNIKLVDAVIEIVDARAPKASRNPEFDRLFAQKERIIVLNKADLSDPASIKHWIAYYQKSNWNAFSFVSTQLGRKGQAVASIEKAVRQKIERMAQRGVKKTVRVMVTGIPNVGKSTFINCLSGSATTAVGNRPGVTRGKQWVKLSPYLELMDTPGMLWPKLEDQQGARYLSYIGAIRDGAMDVEALSVSLAEMLYQRWPDALVARYKKITGCAQGEQWLEEICLSRGYLLSGGILDIERASANLLDEYRSGKIVKAALEVPE